VVSGDAYAERYLWASGLPTNVAVNPATVKIAFSDSKCTRAREHALALTGAKAR